MERYCRIRTQLYSHNSATASELHSHTFFLLSPCIPEDWSFHCWYYFTTSPQTRESPAAGTTFSVAISAEVAPTVFTSFHSSLRSSLSRTWSVLRDFTAVINFMALKDCLFHPDEYSSGNDAKVSDRRNNLTKLFNSLSLLFDISCGWNKCFSNIVI